MKPRIFIAIHYLEIGGAEASLIGLLEALDPAKVDVDLFVYAHHGLFMKAVPEYVNLLPERKAYAMIESPLKEALLAGQLGMVLGRLRAKRLHRTYLATLTEDERKNDISVFPTVSACVMPHLPSLHDLGEYDLAISYLQPHDIVRQKVKAKKYLAWIHTDYSTIHLNVDQELPIWSAYDHIVSISPDVTKGFLQKFPSLASKIVEMENILPKCYILQRASEANDKVSALMKDDVVNLCSIGRIGYAKNYDNVPYMAKALKEFFDEGRKTKDENSINHFKWYIVGPGDHSAIDALSKELGVDDVVTFVGSSNNPYTWLKACDIYVHPSRYEGKSIVVREAQILCKPVIITNYPTAKSQINDGMDGIICELDNQKIAEAIYQLANDNKMQNEIIAYLQNHDFAGLAEVNKIYQLLEFKDQEFKN